MSARDPNQSVDSLEGIPNNKTRTRSPGNFDDPISKLPTRSLHSDMARDAGGREDATVYIHNDDSTPPRGASTMNQVFYIEELVRQVAFNADDGPPGSASLLALACCCKTLEGPVMDVLWQRQKCLHTILETLPADCWTITDKVYVSGKGVSTIHVTHPSRVSAYH